LTIVTASVKSSDMKPVAQRNLSPGTMRCAAFLAFSVVSPQDHDDLKLGAPST